METSIGQVRAVIAKEEMAQCVRQRSISRLSSVNMLLIKIMEVLELKPENDDGLTDLQLRYRQALLPEVGRDDERKDKKQKFAKLGVNDVYTINARLRTLLVGAAPSPPPNPPVRLSHRRLVTAAFLAVVQVIMSREYYNSGKEVKVAFDGYEALRLALKSVEGKNRYVPRGRVDAAPCARCLLSTVMASHHTLCAQQTAMVPFAQVLATRLGRDPQGRAKQRNEAHDESPALGRRRLLHHGRPRRSPRRERRAGGVRGADQNVPQAADDRHGRQRHVDLPPLFPRRGVPGDAVHGGRGRARRVERPPGHSVRATGVSVRELPRPAGPHDEVHESLDQA